MPGFQPARSTVVARWLQGRCETGRAIFEIAEGVRSGDSEKRDREPLRPSSQTAVYRRRVHRTITLSPTVKLNFLAIEPALTASSRKPLEPGTATAFPFGTAW